MNLTGLDAGKTKDVGKIEGLDLSQLLEPLPEIDVSTKGNTEALTTLLDYTKKQLARVPWGQKSVFPIAIK